MSALKFFVTLFLLSFLCLTTEAQNATFLSNYCPNTTTFTRNSTYQSNLKIVLSALSSNATVTNGFYNTTSGENPNMVYGLFLCRGDVSTTVCRDCVAFAAGDSTQRCPVEKEVVAWYDECLLRYSYQSIFSTLSNSVNVTWWIDQNATDPTRFNDAVMTVMNDATTQAASVAKRFATKEANISVFRTLYSLVQCTPDLSSTDCNRCFRRAISSLPGCCSGKIGARIMYPSCYVRYEVYPFYSTSAARPPGTETNPKGKVSS